MLGTAILTGDEELGKKNDDHRPGFIRGVPSWAPRTSPLRWRRRRMLLAVLVLYLIYILARNMAGPGDTRRLTTPYTRGLYGIPARPTMADDEDTDSEPTGPPPGTPRMKDGTPVLRTFDGPILFYRLGRSLRSTPNSMGGRVGGRSVLFFASTPTSLSRMLPIICDMAKHNRNWVHAALAGRAPLPLSQFLEFNGVNDSDCPATWHDARPDFAEYSTDSRNEDAIADAMDFIQSYITPQVAIIDHARFEESGLVGVVRRKALAFKIPLIEGPERGWEGISWMARLDTSSLIHWQQPVIDILIQVPPRSSNVIRLLKSIHRASYAGLKVPRITIELPAEVDKSVERFLSHLSWPKDGGQSKISIRRRLERRRVTQEESAVRFVELFYPKSLEDAYVLVLSPDVEVSTNYFQYVTYALLQYRYSTFARSEAQSLFGISLHLPSHQLDGVALSPSPGLEDLSSPRHRDRFPDTLRVPFLWQAPDSHAILFMGDKWAEFHSFVEHRLAKRAQASDTAPTEKFVSATLPTWVEYMLELMRARGYAILYPGSRSGEALVTVHQEAYHAPEEYSPAARDDQPQDEEMHQNKPIVKSDIAHDNPQDIVEPLPPRDLPLLLSLPFDGEIIDLVSLPSLLYDGKSGTRGSQITDAFAYANEFRNTIGGCPNIEGKARVVLLGTARDLFCFGDEEGSDWFETGREDQTWSIGFSLDSQAIATSMEEETATLATVTPSTATAT